jgi:hypothetical protein
MARESSCACTDVRQQQKRRRSNALFIMAYKGFWMLMLIKNAAKVINVLLASPNEQATIKKYTRLLQI